MLCCQPYVLSQSVYIRVKIKWLLNYLSLLKNCCGWSLRGPYTIICMSGGARSPLSPLVLLKKFCHALPGVAEVVEPELTSLPGAGVADLGGFRSGLCIWPEVALPLAHWRSHSLPSSMLAQEEEPLGTPWVQLCRQSCWPSGLRGPRLPGSGTAAWHLHTQIAAAQCPPMRPGRNPALSQSHPLTFNLNPSLRWKFGKEAGLFPTCC